MDRISVDMIAERIERVTNDRNGNPIFRAHWMDFCSLQEAAVGYARDGEERAEKLGWRPERRRGGGERTAYYRIVSYVGRSELARQIYCEIYEPED